MKRVIDTLSGDLFEIPKANPMEPGAWRFHDEIANAMSDAIKACDKDRYQIAADMSRILGREVSVNTLNKFTSEASEEHMPSLERAMAFDAVTGQLAIISVWAAKLGCRVIPGKEVLKYEMGKYQQIANDAARHIRTISKILGEEK